LNLEQASRWRNLIGRAGGAICFLALLALLDGLIVQFREPLNILRVLPGTTVELNGPLEQEVKGVQDLGYTCDTERLHLTITAVHKGYFLGGDMWRGRLTVSPRLQPGEYRLWVVVKDPVSPRPNPGFRILVFADERSLHQNSKSFLRRYTGLSPWWLAAGLVPGIGLAFGVVFLLSLKREALLAEMGRAEIYRVTKRDGGFEVAFGLGSRHGVGPGASLRILGPTGRPLGTVEVQESTLTDSTGIVTGEPSVKPGDLVCREG